ncbi:transcription termination factor 3, mitochondrial-like isoform X2 [Homarus americanus]|uniref:transcription termination factor 3, mitochondrial-like isoform X2 n=1 Tax=Homarus americanus TaxID=6706 RepID=UPI001C462E24|nr:transcription termination factor 3, mitochondrial-like isoform X2 [Homarus americanus]
MNLIRNKLQGVFGSLLIRRPPLQSLTIHDVKRRDFACICLCTMLSRNSYFQDCIFQKNNRFFQNVYYTSDCIPFKEKSNSDLITTTKSSRTHELMPQEEVCGSVTLMEEIDIPVSDEDGDWTSEMRWITSQESRDVLFPAKDVSEIDALSPELRPSFNIAAYVNRSETLQELVKLRVDLSKWEKRRGISSFILRLDFEKDMKRHIMFLHDMGVLADNLGWWLTINPLIFREKLDDLHTRVNYLQSKKFTSDQITRVISKNPYWLLFSTIRIDNRLGYFQRTFGLTGAEVRLLASKRPQLITLNFNHIMRTSFAVLEEMGFNQTEMKSLLLTKPKIWTMVHLCKEDSSLPIMKWVCHMHSSFSFHKF